MKFQQPIETFPGLLGILHPIADTFHAVCDNVFIYMFKLAIA